MLSRTPPILLLLLLLLLHTGLVVLNHPGAPTSDDKVYFEEAKNIIHGTWELNESPKNHRFGVILPAALSIAVFGETALGIYAWPLLCSLLTLCLLFNFVLNRFGLWNAFLSTGMLAVSIDQIIYSGALFPDVISSFFLFAAGIFLFESTQKWKMAIVSGVLFFLAIWIRETAFLFLPALLLSSIFFPGDDRSRRGLKAFCITVAGGIMIWILTFWRLSGDPSFVYSTVNEHHNKVFANPEKIDLFSRLLIDPFKMISSSLSLLPLLILSLLALVNPFLPKSLPPFLPSSQSTRTIVLWFIGIVIFLWFGTTSFTEYSPLPLLERFWIILLPIMSILSVQSLSLIKDPLLNKVVGASVLIALTFLALYFTFNNSPVFAAN